MEESRNENTDLVERIKILKGEVDAIQIKLLREHTPWYKNIPVIVSIAALLFSLGTTYVSYDRTETQDIQNSKSELRSILQRIALLPKENLELQEKYSDDSEKAAFLSGYINQENSLLAKQAHEIVNRLPPSQVSSTEYLAVGQALLTAYDDESAKNLLRQANKTADTINEELGSLRIYANFLYITGQPEAGKIEYKKAKDAFTQYPMYNDYTQKSSHIETELAWSYSEANIGNISSAMQHVSIAEDIVSTLTPSPGKELLQKQITQARALFESLTIPSSPYLNLRVPFGLDDD